jgi:hypothetical protein
MQSASAKLLFGRTLKREFEESTDLPGIMAAVERNRDLLQVSYQALFSNAGRTISQMQMILESTEPNLGWLAKRMAKRAAREPDLGVERSESRMLGRMRRHDYEEIADTLDRRERASYDGIVFYSSQVGALDAVVANSSNPVMRSLLTSPMGYLSVEVLNHFSVDIAGFLNGIHHEDCAGLQGKTCPGALFMMALMQGSENQLRLDYMGRARDAPKQLLTPETIAAAFKLYLLDREVWNMQSRADLLFPDGTPEIELSMHGRRVGLFDDMWGNLAEFYLDNKAKETTIGDLGKSLTRTGMEFARIFRGEHFKRGIDPEAYAEAVVDNCSGYRIRRGH